MEVLPPGSLPFLPSETLSMRNSSPGSLSRRSLLQQSALGAALATGAVEALAADKPAPKAKRAPKTQSVPKVHVGESNTIRVALVGCGGRGTGAAVHALSVTDGPIELVAMAYV